MSEIQVKRHDGGVVELVLNRAPVNALSAPFLQEFEKRLADLSAEDAVRAIVLTSPFKVFSAGLDLKEAQGFDIPAQDAIVKGLNEGFLALYASPKPTVCAVNGAAIAGGLFFVVGSDLRILSHRARLGLAEVRVGASFPVGPMEIARATLSPDMLRRLMLTGQPIDAQTAHAAGIADVLDDETRTRALDEAKALARIPPLTYATVKRQIRGATIALIEAEIAAGGNTPEGGWFNSETRTAMRAMIG